MIKGLNNIKNAVDKNIFLNVGKFLKEFISRLWIKNYKSFIVNKTW